MPVVYCDGGCLGNGTTGSEAYGSVAFPGEYPEQYEYGIGRTNNEAEYLALIDALEGVRARGLKDVKVLMDSQLVVEQVSGRWRVHKVHLRPLHQEACGLLRETGARVEWAPREEIVARLGH